MLVVASCGGGGGGGGDGGGGGPATVNLSGAAAKGPFASGTTVEIVPLTASGAVAPGASSTVATDDLGNFALAGVEGDSLVLLEATGTFRNELDGAMSSTPMTLRGVYYLTDDASQVSQVNLLTHLASARILALLQAGGITGPAAISRAEGEVRAALAEVIAAPQATPFRHLSLYGPTANNPGGAYLLAVSAVAAQYAVARSHALASTPDAELHAIIDALAADLADGGLSDTAVRDGLLAAVPEVDPEVIGQNLAGMAQAAGSSLIAVNIDLALDPERDGLVNAQDPDDDNDGFNDQDDAFRLDPAEWLDSDGDQTGDNADPDDDNDGTGDTSDAFPLNPAESADNDLDGSGDNADTDDDNDDVTDAADAYSKDGTCYLADDGNGTRCTVGSQIPASYTAQQITVDGRGIVYLLDGPARRIYRWSPALNAYLFPLRTDDGVTRIAYSPVHDRLYVGYGSGQIIQHGVRGTLPSQPFAATPLAVNGLAAAGNFILAQDDTGAWESHHLFDGAGVLKASKEWNHYSRVYAWNPVLNRIYFFRDGTSPNDLHYEAINQTTGSITAEGETPYHGDYTIAPPIRVSTDGTRVLLGSGDIYDASSLNWVGALPTAFTDGRWLAGGGTVIIRPDGSDTALERRNSTGTIVEVAQFSGSPLALLATPAGMVVVTAQDRPAFHLYTPNDDSDGDGSLNTLDAFPLDAAASVDSDGDGYPDAWNPGKTQSDSTTGLVLDSYPRDSACYLPGHGDGVTCNIGSTIPAYTPDQVVIGGDGIIYLLHRASNRVYRWDSVGGSHLNPIPVGSNSLLDARSPTLMAYAPAQSRLYLGYPGGAITRIDLLGNLAEQDFASTSKDIGGLQAAGNFLWVGAPAAGTTARYNFVYDAAGNRTANVSGYYSREAAWNASLSRMYYFRDGISPNDLLYQQINQSSGLITSSGETPYHGDYSIASPIRLSPDGAKVLLGSGDIYDAASLTWLGALPTAFTDGRWLADGGTVIIRPNGANTALERRNSAGTVVETAQFSGTPVGLFPAGASFIVVTLQGQPTFQNYTPNDDSDGDGVANTADPFPIDAAASVDSDGDGYPNAWNPGRTQADSTTGLVLDSYPDDSACYLPGHGDGVTCNIGSTIPAYTPDQTVIDDAGIVYLLSKADNRVYRWDGVTRQHLNPIIVGSTSFLATSSPGIMAYSSGHFRLYLGYDSGAITYVDLAAELVEQNFATTAEAVRGLVATGNFVLAQDSSGAWATHYIFDESGARRTSVDWNRYSRAYAWNPALNRVYFFRDDTSPNDLHYEEINQGTGLITAQGETPYHGDYSVAPPIRVSADGSKVLLGSGDIYDASSLTWLGALPTAFTDGRWLPDGGTVIIRPNGDNTVLERRNAAGTVIEIAQFSGSPLGIHATVSSFIVVTSQGQPAFFPYTPNDDSDGDGSANTEDAFPLDAAASVDSDGDGYPNAWNPGKTQADSNTGLVLDSYPNDSACYLPGHGDGVTCNVGSTIPAYTPDQTVVDATGVIYLLSEANNRIYRWDSVAGQHLNPIVVGSTSFLSTTSPTLMAYSPQHTRLYLGYESGAITYVNLAGPLVEQGFATTAEAVRGLVATGNFVLAQDSSGAWATHYIFDVNGAQRTSVDWNRYSGAYAWNPALNRVYFFRDDTSPNDLHYEVINQASGLITSSGETPYHGSYNMVPPIRVSPGRLQGPPGERRHLRRYQPDLARRPADRVYGRPLAPRWRDGDHPAERREYSAGTAQQCRHGRRDRAVQRYPGRAVPGGSIVRRRHRAGSAGVSRLHAE